MTGLRGGATGCLLTAALGLASTRAEAASGARVAVDIDYAHAISRSGIGAGSGGALRLGYKLDAIVLALTPEIGASYHGFSGDQSATHTSGFAGGRLSFGRILEPLVFAHVGVGHLSTNQAGYTGPALDMGVALDFTLLPFIDIGVHAAYDALYIANQDDLHWFRTGLHVAFAFGKH